MPWSEELSRRTKAFESQHRDHTAIQVGTPQEEETFPVPYDQFGEAIKARNGELLNQGRTARNAMTKTISRRILGPQRPLIVTTGELLGARWFARLGVHGIPESNGAWTPLTSRSVGIEVQISTIGAGGFAFGVNHIQQNHIASFDPHLPISPLPCPIHFLGCFYR